MGWSFRGFDIIGGKWVYGDLVHNKKVTKTGLEGRVMVGGYEVAPESVGICLNIKDKEGTMLYEGDIIEIDEDVAKTFDIKRVGEIHYTFGSFYIGRMQWSKVEYICSFSQVLRGKVIGNVFENKDLLKRYD